MNIKWITFSKYFNKWPSTCSNSIFFPSSSDIDVTVLSLMPQGTIAWKGANSLHTFRASPCIVIQLEAATPMAAIFRNLNIRKWRENEITFRCWSTQTPTSEVTPALIPKSPTVLITMSCSPFTYDLFYTQNFHRFFSVQSKFITTNSYQYSVDFFVWIILQFENLEKL